MKEHSEQVGQAGQAGQGPGMQEAIDVLRQLLEHATWDDVDARTEAGAKKTLARWQVIEMALARLAAAPDLLAACQALMDAINSGVHVTKHNSAYIEAGWAVAKAEGR